MTRKVHIHPEAPRVRKTGEREVSARIAWPRWFARLRAQWLWFRAPAAATTAVEGDATSAVLGALFPCMELGRPVRVHGTLAPGLRENLDRYQANWARWRPARYRHVSIEAEGTTPPATGGEGTLLTYSGGIDSTQAVKRLQAGGTSEARDALRACVMAHGFDIPLDQAEGFASATARARRILASRGVPLHLAATNVREIPQEWNDSNRAAIAAVLHMFRGRHAVGVVANAYEEGFARRFFPEEVEDMPLLGSDDLPLRFAPSDRDRIGRLEELLDWPEALADLRVCWMHPTGAGNCGRCGKCIIVILAARVLGAGRLPCFDRDVEDDEILAMLADRHEIIPFRAQQLLEHAVRRGLDEPWMQVAAQVRGEDPLRRIRRAAAAAGRAVPEDS